MFPYKRTAFFSGTPNLFGPSYFEVALTLIVFRAKSKCYNPKTVKKLALNSQLLTVQIVTNDVQVLILCLSFILLLLYEAR